MPKHDEEIDIAHIDNASEEQDRSDESVTVYDDNENKVSYSNLSIYDIYYPYIIGIKFWQAHSVAWINSFVYFSFVLFVHGNDASIQSVAIQQLLLSA